MNLSVSAKCNGHTGKVISCAEWQGSFQVSTCYLVTGYFDIDMFLQRGGNGEAHVVGADRKIIMTSFDEYKGLDPAGLELNKRLQGIEQRLAAIGYIIHNDNDLIIEIMRFT